MRAYLASGCLVQKSKYRRTCWYNRTNTDAACPLSGAKDLAVDVLERDPAYPAVAYRSPIAGTRAVRQGVCSELLTQLNVSTLKAAYTSSLRPHTLAA